LVDGIDLRQLDPAELRHQIGYVQQDIMLFYGSLRENITMGAPLSTDADVVKAAEVGGILNLVNQHPQGFDMLVGERGESLSGGQSVKALRLPALSLMRHQSCCWTSRLRRWITPVRTTSSDG
jgi:ABC-type multidrug transport system fused ATPase/permease subunit